MNDLSLETFVERLSHKLLMHSLTTNYRPLAGDDLHDMLNDTLEEMQDERQR